MREEWIDIAGGTPALKQWAESPSEAALSAVERSLLDATLLEAVGDDERVRRQVESATWVCREFTGYGEYLVLTVSPECEPAEGVGRFVAGTTLAWRQALVRQLSTVAWFERGTLKQLELFPTDGQNWSVSECRSIMAAPLHEVVIGDGADQSS